MNIVDQYLEANYKTKSVYVMSRELGIPMTLITTRLHKEGRIANLEAKTIVEPELDGFDQEYKALLYFIQERRTGVLVDIAKTRVKQLEQSLKLTKYGTSSATKAF